MEHQIQRSISSEHQLLVEGKLFVEKKESFTWLEPTSERRVSHTRQIGDDKFYTIHQTVDKDGNMTDQTIETNLKTEEDLDTFHAEWESGWHPTLTESSSSDGFLASLKNTIKFW